MITRIVKLVLDDTYSESFRELFEMNKSRIASSEGCLTVNLFEDIDVPGMFFTISTWKSEDHLNNYRKSAVFGSIWPQVKNWMIDKPEAWSLQ